MHIYSIITLCPPPHGDAETEMEEVWGKVSKNSADLLHIVPSCSTQDWKPRLMSRGGPAYASFVHGRNVWKNLHILKS